MKSLRQGTDSLGQGILRVLGWLLLLRQVSRLAEAANCDLDCRNGGTCQRRRYLPDHSLRTLLEARQQQRHYCSCPKGYAGALCEIKYHLCGGGAEAICSNGAPCQRDVDGNNQDYFHCECDLTVSDLSFSYASKLCQHASTVFCRENNNPAKAKKDRHSLGGTAQGSFCMNGGTCLPADDNKHHAGCHCLDGYSGMHCEVDENAPKQKKQASSLQTTTGGSSVWMRRVLVFSGIFCSIVGCGLAYLVRLGNRDKVPRKKLTAEERARIPDRQQHPEVELS